MRRSFILAALPVAALIGQAACGTPTEQEIADDTALQRGHGGIGGHGGRSHSSSSSSSSGHTVASSSSSSSGAHTTSSSSTSASSTSGASTSSGGATTGVTSSSSTSSSSTTSSSSGTGSSSEGGLFQATNPWNTAVDADPASASSAAITGWLAANGGWGDGTMRIDFSINLLTASASTPLLPFTPNGNFYTPDCDQVPFPVPAVGAVEGETGYTCTQGGDCHLLVVYPPTNKLYEMYSASISGSTFSGGCVAVWDLTRAYPANLRGDGCSSADAGGFPISAMLFTADEVYAGEIPHAIRFILPNARIRGGGVYVHPGTHTTSATSGAADAPPYGVRFRLRADYPLASLPSAGAQVVARAMQKYGMFLADGGNIALTAANDVYTTHKWTDVAIDSNSLNGILVTDMEVVDMGATVPTQDCVRNP